MEHDDLANPRRCELAAPLRERPQVEVADRAPGEPAELEVNALDRIRELDRLVVDGAKSAQRDMTRRTYRVPAQANHGDQRARGRNALGHAGELDQRVVRK